MKSWVWFFLLAFIVLVSSNAFATMNCAVRQFSCAPGESTVFHLNNIGNAHAELSSGTQYDYKVCCGTNTSQSIVSDPLCNAPIQQTLLNLSGSTNAHAEQTGLGNYSTPVCLSVNSGGVSCGYYASNLSASTAGYQTCLARLSSTTNAHLENCLTSATPYPIALGCSAFVAPTAPIANAGGDQTWDVGQNFSLHGSALDFDGQVSTLAWSISPTSGCVLTPGAPSGLNTNNARLDATVQCTDVNFYVATLVATDNSGLQGSDEANIRINPVGSSDPRPPNADAGPDVRGNAGQSLPVHGIGTDSDGTIFNMVWSVSNPLCVVTPAAPNNIGTNNATIDAGISCSADGEYIATLTVTDDLGLISSDSAKLFVGSGGGWNNDPTISIDLNPSPNALDTQDLNCAIVSADDPDRDIIWFNFKWFKNNSTTAFSDINSLPIGYSDYSAGILSSDIISSSQTSASDEWRCEVTPFDGTSFGSTQKRTTTIIPPGICPNAPPIALCRMNSSVIPKTNASPPPLPAPIDFTAQWSVDPEGFPLTYNWGAISPNPTSGPTPNTDVQTQAVFNTAGTFTIPLSVTDNCGVTASNSCTIEVSATSANQAPTCVMVSPVNNGPNLPNGGLVSFNATGSSDPDDAFSTLQFEWDSNVAGLVAVGPNAGAVLSSGSHNIRLTVTDPKGAQSVCDANIFINAHPYTQASWTPSVLTLQNQPDKSNLFCQGNAGVAQGIQKIELYCDSSVATVSQTCLFNPSFPSIGTCAVDCSFNQAPLRVEGMCLVTESSGATGEARPILQVNGISTPAGQFDVFEVLSVIAEAGAGVGVTKFVEVGSASSANVELKINLKNNSGTAQSTGLITIEFRNAINNQLVTKQTIASQSIGSGTTITLNAPVSPTFNLSSYPTGSYVFVVKVPASSNEYALNNIGRRSFSITQQSGPNQIPDNQPWIAALIGIGLLVFALQKQKR